MSPSSLYLSLLLQQLFITFIGQIEIILNCNFELRYFGGFGKARYYRSDFLKELYLWQINWLAISSSSGSWDEWGWEKRALESFFFHTQVGTNTSDCSNCCGWKSAADKSKYEWILQTSNINYCATRGVTYNTKRN